MIFQVVLLPVFIGFLLTFRLAESRGVLYIKLNEFYNPLGRTYQGYCCDAGYVDADGVCIDQCDYVMRLIISGLGRANDHVFLFHRPLKYDSNNVVFKKNDSSLVLTVLFDKWPHTGRVQMNAFFYDYDDYDHTTTLVDWFEADLLPREESIQRDTGRHARGSFQSQAAVGNRRDDQTQLTFQWSALCDEGSECFQSASLADDLSLYNNFPFFEEFGEMNGFESAYEYKVPRIKSKNAKRSYRHKQKKLQVTHDKDVQDYEELDETRPKHQNKKPERKSLKSETEKNNIGKEMLKGQMKRDGRIGSGTGHSTRTKGEIKSAQDEVSSRAVLGAQKRQMITRKKLKYLNAAIRGKQPHFEEVARSYKHPSPVQRAGHAKKIKSLPNNYTTTRRGRAFDFDITNEYESSSVSGNQHNTILKNIDEDRISEVLAVNGEDKKTSFADTTMNDSVISEITDNAEKLFYDDYQELVEEKGNILNGKHRLFTSATNASSIDGNKPGELFQEWHREISRTTKGKELGAESGHLKSHIRRTEANQTTPLKIESFHSRLSDLLSVNGKQEAAKSQTPGDYDRKEDSDAKHLQKEQEPQKLFSLPHSKHPEGEYDYMSQINALQTNAYYDISTQSPIASSKSSRQYLKGSRITFFTMPLPNTERQNLNNGPTKHAHDVHVTTRDPIHEGKISENRTQSEFDREKTQNIHPERFIADTCNGENECLNERHKQEEEAAVDKNLAQKTSAKGQSKDSVIKKVPSGQNERLSKIKQYETQAAKGDFQGLSTSKHSMRTARPEESIVISSAENPFRMILQGKNMRQSTNMIDSEFLRQSESETQSMPFREETTTNPLTEYIYSTRQSKVSTGLATTGKSDVQNVGENRREHANGKRSDFAPDILSKSDRNKQDSNHKLTTPAFVTGFTQTYQQKNFHLTPQNKQAMNKSPERKSKIRRRMYSIDVTVKPVERSEGNSETPWIRDFNKKNVLNENKVKRELYKKRLLRQNRVKRPSNVDLLYHSIKKLKSMKFQTAAPVHWYVTEHPAFRKTQRNRVLNSYNVLKQTPSWYDSDSQNNAHIQASDTKVKHRIENQAKDKPFPDKEIVENEDNSDHRYGKSHNKQTNNPALIPNTETVPTVKLIHYDGQKLHQSAKQFSHTVEDRIKNTRAPYHTTLQEHQQEDLYDTKRHDRLKQRDSVPQPTPFMIKLNTNGETTSESYANLISSHRYKHSKPTAKLMGSIQINDGNKFYTHSEYEGETHIQPLVTRRSPHDTSTKALNPAANSIKEIQTSNEWRDAFLGYSTNKERTTRRSWEEEDENLIHQFYPPNLLKHIEKPLDPTTAKNEPNQDVDKKISSIWSNVVNLQLGELNYHKATSKTWMTSTRTTPSEESQQNLVKTKARKKPQYKSYTEKRIIDGQMHRGGEMSNDDLPWNFDNTWPTKDKESIQKYDKTAGDTTAAYGPPIKPWKYFRDNAWPTKEKESIQKYDKTAGDTTAAYGPPIKPWKYSRDNTWPTKEKESIQKYDKTASDTTAAYGPPIKPWKYSRDNTWPTKEKESIQKYDKTASDTTAAYGPPIKPWKYSRDNTWPTKEKESIQKYDKTAGDTTAAYGPPIKPWKYSRDNTWPTKEKESIQNYDKTAGDTTAAYGPPIKPWKYSRDNTWPTKEKESIQNYDKTAGDTTAAYGPPIKPWKYSRDNTWPTKEKESIQKYDKTAGDTTAAYGPPIKPWKYSRDNTWPTKEKESIQNYDKTAGDTTAAYGPPIKPWKYSRDNTWPTKEKESIQNYDKTAGDTTAAYGPPIKPWKYFRDQELTIQSLPLTSDATKRTEIKEKLEPVPEIYVTQLESNLKLNHRNVDRLLNRDETKTSPDTLYIANQFDSLSGKIEVPHGSGGEYESSDQTIFSGHVRKFPRKMENPNQPQTVSNTFPYFHESGNFAEKLDSLEQEPDLSGKSTYPYQEHVLRKGGVHSKDSLELSTTRMTLDQAQDLFVSPLDAGQRQTLPTAHLYSEDIRERPGMLWYTSHSPKLTTASVSSGETESITDALLYADQPYEPLVADFNPEQLQKSIDSIVQSSQKQRSPGTSSDTSKSFNSFDTQTESTAQSVYSNMFKRVSQTTPVYQVLVPFMSKSFNFLDKAFLPSKIHENIQHNMSQYAPVITTSPTATTNSPDLNIMFDMKDTSINVDGISRKVTPKAHNIRHRPIDNFPKPNVSVKYKDETRDYPSNEGSITQNKAREVVKPNSTDKKSVITDEQNQIVTETWKQSGIPVSTTGGEWNLNVAQQLTEAPMTYHEANSFQSLTGKSSHSLWLKDTDLFLSSPPNSDRSNARGESLTSSSNPLFVNQKTRESRRKPSHQRIDQSTDNVLREIQPYLNKGIMDIIRTLNRTEGKKKGKLNFQEDGDREFTILSESKDNDHKTATQMTRTSSSKLNDIRVKPVESKMRSHSELTTSKRFIHELRHFKHDVTGISKNYNSTGTHSERLMDHSTEPETQEREISQISSVPPYSLEIDHTVTMYSDIFSESHNEVNALPTTDSRDPYLTGGSRLSLSVKSNAPLQPTGRSIPIQLNQKSSTHTSKGQPTSDTILDSSTSGQFIDKLHKKDETQRSGLISDIYSTNDTTNKDSVPSDKVLDPYANPENDPSPPALLKLQNATTNTQTFDSDKLALNIDPIATQSATSEGSEIQPISVSVSTTTQDITKHPILRTTRAREYEDVTNGNSQGNKTGETKDNPTTYGTKSPQLSELLSEFLEYMTPDPKDAEKAFTINAKTLPSTEYPAENKMEVSFAKQHGTDHQNYREDNVPINISTEEDRQQHQIQDIKRPYIKVPYLGLKKPPPKQSSFKPFVPELNIPHEMKALPEMGFILQTLQPHLHIQKATMQSSNSHFIKLPKVKKMSRPRDINVDRFREFVYNIRHGPKLDVPLRALYGSNETRNAINFTGGAHELPQLSRREGVPRANFKSVKKVFTRYWPAVLGVTIGTIFLLAGLATSLWCKQHRLLIQRARWTDSPQHLSEPPDTSEYATSSAASLTSDLARSSMNLV